MKKFLGILIFPVFGDKENAEYWKDENAQEILSAYVANMNSRGYIRVDDREEADLGLQVSYVRSTYYFTDYGLKGKGFPVYKKEGQFGDLIVTYSVKLPTNLTEQQKEMFRKIQSMN